MAEQPKILCVSLFGGCSIMLDGHDVHVANRKAKAMLGFLAFEPHHRVTRERLVGMLWSEMPEDRARHNLRQSLLIFQKAMDDVAFTAFETLYADPGFEPGSVRYDVLDVLESIRRDDPVDILINKPRIAHTLLQGFDDIDPSFHSWLTVERESLAKQMIRELTDRLTLQTSPTPTAKRLAQALLNLDPTHEPACRVVMRACADAGDTAGAIAAYNALFRELDELHGQLPSQETEDLIVAIKSGTYQCTPAKLPAFGFVDLRPAPLMPKPQKLVLIIGAFDHIGPKKELSIVFRHELMSRLSKFREWLLVDGEPPNPPAVDGAACYTLSAPAMENGGDLMLMLSMKDSRTGDLVFSESKSIALDAFFPSLGRIVREIASRLNVYISVERLNHVLAGPRLPQDVFDRWALGQALTLQWQPGNRERSRTIFESIIHDAPNFSPAYSSLAQMDNSDHLVLAGVYRTPETHQRALERAMKAVELDPLDSRAQLALAWARSFDGNFELATTHFDQAYRANADDAWTVTSAALGYAYAGEISKALTCAARANDLTPVPRALHWCYLSAVGFIAEDYEACISAGQRAGDSVPALAAWMAAANIQLGRHDVAQNEAHRFLRMVRASWHGAVEPSERAIVRWFLRGFPIRDIQLLDRLRSGLSGAGLDVSDL